VNTAEGAGRTVEEAIERALKDIELQRSEVDVEVLQEPRPALLGLGGREARVRVARPRRTSLEILSTPSLG
jgi:spoIIIJ-associated protein